MKGIITKIAHDGSRWMVARGEDGVEYFIGCKNLINPKQYKHYAYKGNLVVFDKDESQEWRLPHGCNATLAEIADPNREQKRLNWIAAEKARLEKEERKRQEREKQAILKARADQRREFEANNTWWYIQQFSDGEWKPVYSGAVPLKYRSLEEAKAKIRELDAGARYRVVKRAGLAVTVRRKGGRRNE